MNASRPLRILYVAYFYPPCRDTGALRPTSMVTWLRELGHEVTVLTTSAYGSSADDGDDVIRTRDAQLWRARMGGKETIGALFDADTYSGQPHFLSSVVVPEPLALAWAPFARRAALKLTRGREFDCVVTTSPPESTHRIGRTLKDRRGLPWVADIRDAWMFESLRPEFPTAAQKRLDERLERRWLGDADAVVCVSRPAVTDLCERLGIAAEFIPNGWDPRAQPAKSVAGTDASPLDPQRVSLVYTGRFGSYGRDPGPLVEGLERLAASSPQIAEKLELVIAGPLRDDEKALFSADVRPARILLLGSCERAAALELQREADALLLIAQPTRSQLLNIKLFEYLASGTPILALASGTEAGRVVEEVGGVTVAADDPEAIAGALERLVSDGITPPAPDAVAPFTYPAPAEQLAAVLERTVVARSSSSNA